MTSGGPQAATSLARVTPAELADAVQIAVYTAVQAGELDVDVPREIHLERSKRRDHGDYASNVAMQLAKSAGMPPREVAEVVARHLRGAGGVRAVEVAGPGFLNISLDSETAGRLALTIVAGGPAYGRSETLRKQRINLEFVSANPTGPVHLGHTRWAAVGDSLRRILEAAGADVVSEYYINDAGVQMQKFAASIYAAAHGQEPPEDGYGGEYIADVAKRILEAAPQLIEESEADAVPEMLERGYRLMLTDIAASLERFRVHFDVWFSERGLHNSGRVDEAIATLRDQGHVFDHEGAVWLRTTDFGDDKDRVMVKADGEKTYFAADAAYYLDKRQRGFDTCVYLLGADHHGYINRLRALAACAGDDPDRSVQVLIGQLVKLLRGGEELKMSKRAGTVVTLDELVDLVGVDAARYSLSRASTDSQLTLDVEEITRAAPENPVYYVQYVAARTASLARNARELGLSWSAPESFRPQLLTDDREALLLGALGEFPRTVATAAELREPHRIARYLEDLAGTYHRFYDGCRILPRGEEEVSDLHLARLWLNDATRTVISNGLAMLGVSAPERM
jgi:arginyl-tRNA synthetase